MGEPRQREQSRLYHYSADTFEDAETQISGAFEEQLAETRWREHLRLGVEGQG